MARSFRLHPAQALSAAQLYSHWKWRVLLLVNAYMFWGFGPGDLVHGRLSDRFSPRLWVTLGGVLTTVFNWLTSFGVSAGT